MAIFVFTASALAQDAPAAAPGAGEVFLRMLPLFAIVFFIFYFLVIRPQDKQMKRQQALIAGLKRGDMVVTTGGIIARVGAVEPDALVLDLSGNAKLRIEKAHVARKYEKQGQGQSEKEKAAVKK